MTDAAIDAGHVVTGRYRLVKRLGEGGMGTVWVADDLSLHSQVALKLLHGAVLESEDGLQRFSREAQAAAKLRSPHVVQILEHGIDGGVPFIAMELLEGESLATRLARLSTLSLAQTSRVVTHVARAIGKAHDVGIVHRDLKPDNIFIVRNDDEEIIKVLDFGIAKMDRAAEPSKISTQAGSLLGTPHYMSPEQVRGHGVDWRSDLWSLAMIAFECVCGRLPFEGRTVGDILVVICSEPIPKPSTFRPVPAAFDEWFAKAATRSVQGRFQSAKEMAEALRGVAGEQSRTPLPAVGDSGRYSASDARTLSQDEDSQRQLERAHTVSAGGHVSGTIGGASSAIHQTRSRTSLWLIAGGAVVLGATFVAITWTGRLGRSAPRTTSRAIDVEQASVAVASVTIPASPVPSAPPSTASSIVPIASASVAPAASSSHRAAARVRNAPAPTAKSDELTF